jgi:hypothetical protein
MTRGALQIRTAQPSDLQSLLELYRYLMNWTHEYRWRMQIEFSSGF